MAIVDDDRPMCKAMARLVRLHGYTAYTFTSAEAFLASPHLTETECLITDIRMPGMSGFDLKRALTSSGYDIPVIFVTGHGEERGMADAAGFLTKPFDGHALIGCLRAALGVPAESETAR